MFPSYKVTCFFKASFLCFRDNVSLFGVSKIEKRYYERKNFRIGIVLLKLCFEIFRCRGMLFDNFDKEEVLNIQLRSSTLKLCLLVRCVRWSFHCRCTMLNFLFERHQFI